jgi:GntR family transcriptional regulator, transcriptional repressor for pyruvate dehydrogenase complex
VVFLQREENGMFRTVRPDKISESISQQIRDAIFAGLLKPGDKLPAERELVHSFGVSKASMREALRSLEVLGFIQIRKGVAGGSFVTEVHPQKARELINNFLHFKNLSLANLTEVRLILETHTAAVAARTIEPADLERLQALIDEGAADLERRDMSRLRHNEIEFHRVIGNACCNPLLSFILDAVHHLLVDAKDVLQPSFEFSVKVLKAHSQIFYALGQRDPEAARREMAQHLADVERDLALIQKQIGIRGHALARPGIGKEKEVMTAGEKRSADKGGSMSKTTTVRNRRV